LIIPHLFQTHNKASYLSGMFTGLGISVCYTGIERRLERR
jgi:hypothetical protein